VFMKYKTPTNNKLCKWRCSATRWWV